MKFSEYDTATKFRDVVSKLIDREIERVSPRVQYGVVASIDRANLKCTVTMVGDTVASTVKMGTIQPNAVGNIVRVDGPLGDRYISEVLNGQAFTTGVMGSQQSLELRSTTGDTFVDFTRTPGTADYNVRLINDADQFLRVYGGRLEVVSGSLNDALSVVGAGANLKLGGRDGGGFTALYSNGGLFRAWTSVAGADIFLAGQTVNGTEWGVKSNYNLEGGEVYARGWFRQMFAGQGYYHQTGLGGWYMNSDAWFRMYQDVNFNTAGWVQGGSVACNGLLRVRAYTDTCHQLAYISGSIGSPSNGTQSIDGPMLSGYNAAALGSAPCRFNNIQFRAWDNGGDYRSDHYSPLYCLQGINVTGTKPFLIDHPVLGPTHHLQYCAIEGPAVDLLFRGRITLIAGKATVNIDDEAGQEEGTFEALCFEEDRQYFLYNETGSGHPHAKWIPGAGDLEITCSDKTATVGWMVLAVRKAGLGDHGLGDDNRLMVEWKKTELELSTTKVQPYEEQLLEQVAELERWKDALPGSERSIDQAIAELQATSDRHVEGRLEMKAKVAKKQEFWNHQKAKAKARKKAKGRA